MNWIIFLIISVILIIYIRYKIRITLYYYKIEKFQKKIKECNITLFKLRSVELHDFHVLLSIQKDLYAKGIRPSGLQNSKYFTVPVPELTLDTVFMYSVDIWHIDSVAFWNNCNSVIGENELNLPEDTLHKTLVFNRYKSVLTGSLGDYLYKLKLEYAKVNTNKIRLFN